MSNGTLTGAEAPIRPLVSLSDAQQRLDAGQVGQAEFTVRNPGNIVETYDVIVLGPAQAWVDVMPPMISLFPGEEDTSTVELRPPLTYRVPAGTYAIGVKAQSQVRPDVSATAEMLVTVNPFYRFRCTMASASFTLRTRATMLIQVTNEGNSTVTYEVKANDPEGFMNVRPKAPSLTLAPGQSQWIEILVSVAPKLIGSEFNTRSFTVTITPVRDEDLGLAILDEDPEELIGSVLQRPFIRLRLGVFGRLLILLTILGLIAGFFISRWAQQQTPPMTGAPRVPVEFAAEPGPGPAEVLLTWQPSSGAQGYTIYAVGAAGNPRPTPEPTVVVELPQGATAGGGAVPRAVIPRVDSEPSEQELAIPVCEGCSEVANVGAGVTRYVVQEVPAGEACYRIAAFADGVQSLFSVAACTEIVDPAVFDSDGDGIPDAEQAGEGEDGAGGAGEEEPPRPCPPIAVDARVVSTSAVAVLWKKATKPPAGFIAPPPPVEVQPGLRGDGTQPGAKPQPGAQPKPNGTSKPKKPKKPERNGAQPAKKRICDPEQEITGWTLQRRIFTGWSDVSPAPAPDDTAVEVRDLSPDTRYCFRLRAVSEQGTSRWSPRACVRTDPEPIVEPSPSDGAPLDAETVRGLPD
jgi:hypothetical protein